MKELVINPDNPKEEKEEVKSQGQLDYEAGKKFLDNKDASLAANAFHNALAEFEKEKDENGIANASDKLGDICALRGDFDNAIKHYDRAYAICEKQSDRFSLFAIEKKKARIAFDAKQYDKAITLYLDILDEYTSLSNPQGSVDTLAIIAEIYLVKGDKAKAADSYRMIASIHRSFKHNNIAATFTAKAEEVEKG
ncbi:MAG: tetratricopeptide repeat protein [Desulfobulbaceae bacterium]|nr:tetratricopeptide repeat protein [Desulfobulbaceae bacterium]HIJ79958.1 tetratricopeptide repeat protein [Deltaproteobacteria bacterium]